MIMEKVKGGGNDASSENDDKLDNAL